MSVRSFKNEPIKIHQLFQRTLPILNLLDFSLMAGICTTDVIFRNVKNMQKSFQVPPRYKDYF